MIRPCFIVPASYQAPELLSQLLDSFGSRKDKRIRPFERTWKVWMSLSVRRPSKTWTSSLPLSLQSHANPFSVSCLETPQSPGGVADNLREHRTLQLKAPIGLRAKNGRLMPQELPKIACSLLKESGDASLQELMQAEKKSVAKR